MNQFVAYCNELFTAEKISLYQFCKIHNLERTGIRRLLNGTRIPKDEVFEAFAASLTLTPKESQKLHKLYLCEKLGSVRYENRIFIKDFLNEIGAHQDFRITSRAIARHVKLSLEDQTMVINNPLELSHLFYFLIETEEKEVYCNLSLSGSSPLPYDFFVLKSSAVFYHILTLLKKSDLNTNENHNLNILKKTVSLALQSHAGYVPLYAYGNPVDQNSTLPYPYYLLTSKHVLFISEDCKQGLLLSDPLLVKQYHIQCKSIQNHMQPLIMHAPSPTQILQQRYDSLQRSSYPLYTFDFFPCLFKIYSEELFVPQLTEQFKDNTQLAQVMNSLSSATEAYPPYEAFLPYESLVCFAETGELSESIRHILKPFSSDKRKTILNRIKSYCEEGSYQLHILPKGYLKIFPKVSLELFSDHRIYILSMDQEQLFLYLYFDENSIYDSFLDYFESLLENPDVSTPEESAHIIQKVIDQYLV